MLHNRIKQLRTENGMTQGELGAKVGVIKQTVSSWENDASAPNYEIISQLCEIFGVSADYLLGISDKRGDDANANTKYLTIEEGNEVLKRALKGTGLVDQDGYFTEKGREVVSDFIAKNADMLDKLLGKSE